MTQEEKVQAKEYLRGKGLRLAILTDEQENLEEYIPLRGELVWVKDRNYLAIGDGKKVTVYNQRFLVRERYDSLISLEDRAREIYRRLSYSMAVGGIKEFLFPPALAQIMIENKPYWFSFMEGEELEEFSPLKEENEWQVIPNALGKWVRTHETRGNSEAKDLNRELGDIQGALVGEHPHEVPQKYIEPLSNMDTSKRNKKSPYKSPKTLKAIAGYALSTSEQENRPWTLNVLRILKIEEPPLDVLYTIANKWDSDEAYVLTDYLDDSTLIYRADRQVGYFDGELRFLTPFFFVGGGTLKSTILNNSGEFLNFRIPPLGELIFKKEPKDFGMTLRKGIPFKMKVKGSYTQVTTSDKRSIFEIT